MGRTAVATLRVLLVVIFTGAALAQVWFFPTLAGEIAAGEPELSWLRWPVLTVVVLAIAGVQAGLVALWVLLAMVESDSVFSPRAFRWVDVIIVAAVLDTVLVLGLNLFLTFRVQVGPPAVVLGLVALATCGAAFALLMGVMKSLLRKASAVTLELSEVI